MTPLPPVRAWPRRAAARVLAPGRAVAGWRLSVTREARRLGRLGRYAEWIRGLTGAPPSLRADEPLGALADVLERSTERAAARHHGPWRRPTDGVGERAESRGRRGSPGERVRGTPATLFPPAATPAAVRARAVQPRAARLRREPPFSAPARGPESAAARLEVVSAGNPPAELGELAADRAARRLLAALPPDAWALPGATSTAGEPRSSAAAAFALPLSSAAVESQWTAAVGGRRAPRDLIWRLSQRLGADAVAPPARYREPSAAEERPAPSTSKGRPSAATAPGAGRELTAADVERGEPSHAGPSVAPSAPPLARAAAGDGLEPLQALATEVPAGGLEPRAEAAARVRLASAESPPHGDELAALAGKVKRILDEEARRHGIDV